MSVQHPGEDPNANLYYQLKRDVLDRIPAVAAVEFVPNRTEATKLKATFDPVRLDVETGPGEPTLVIAWYRQSPDDWFRVDFSDPNTGFHAGWHQDEDHPDLGSAHFQYANGGKTNYETVAFRHETPSLILWEIVENLLTDVLATHYD